MSVPSSNPSADANSDAITSTVCCKLCLIKGLSFEACRRSKNNFSRHLNTEHNKKPVKRKKFYYVFKSDGTPNIPPMELFANHALKTGYAKGKKAHEDAKNGGDDKKAKKQWKSELCLSETTKHLNKIKDNDVDGKKDNNNQHTQQIVHHVPNDLNRSSQSNLLDPSVLNNIPSSLHPLVDMLKQNLLKTQQLQDTLDQFTRKQIECTDVKTFVKIFGNDIYVLEIDSKRVLQTAQEMKAEIDYQIERQDITSFQIRNKNQSLFKHLSTISFDGNAKEWMFKGTLALSLKRYKSTNPPNFCSVCGRGKWFAALVQCCNCDSLIHVNAACSKLIVSKELQSKVKNLACDECRQSKPELLDLPIFEKKKELKKKESKPNKGNLNLNPPKKCKKKKKKKQA
eukprot:41053_1